MATSILDAMFGTHSQRELKKVDALKNKVLSLEKTYRQMTDAQLQAVTPELRERLAGGETLEDVLPDAFAACCEASDRVLGMRPFPVQVIGGIVLHQGRIAEMKTGEGKTLVAVLPAYLNALEGKGVHIVTVNDYLAKFHSEWMGRLYRFMGLSVGLIVHDLTNEERRAAYACDITYGTNNELGFDYLRDNMVTYKTDMVQRDFNFAIVDEVDSILIDEARTPLIISGQGDKSTELYTLANRFARDLKVIRIKEMDDKDNNEDFDGDYIVDEKAKTCTLTPSGVKKAERFFNLENLSDSENMTLQHHINQAIRAHGIMKRDVDYVVKDGQIIIVDEFTGRLMFGRRYSDGLHQAIEAKEGVRVERESKTLATITFQNYFRLYKKLSGMTGTALTEEEEFREIYNLDVIEIPTNRPVVREDFPDSIYKTEKGKFRAIIRQIVECHKKGQPVLVGTISIEKSELLGSMLRREGIKHEILNAKYHEKEAEIIAQAGKKGAVTIATNMAGRGTDIMLGGNAEFLARADLRKAGFTEEQIYDATSYYETEDQAVLDARQLYRDHLARYKAQIAEEAEEVRKAGGLYVIGTERHESRRIDNQLRGRSGRQGDPGASRFYISLEDEIMRLFGGERIYSMMESLGIDEDTPIENKMISRAMEGAQKKVESRNFSTRKNVLKFDDVMSYQREIIYKQRRSVLDGESVKPYIEKMIDESVESIVRGFLTGDVKDNWNMEGLRDHFLGWLVGPEDLRYDELENVEIETIVDLLRQRAHEKYENKEKQYGSELMREVERMVLLRNVDTKWMDHLDAMEELKRGIYLRAYAQKDPVVEYRNEGFEMFEALVASIREDTVKMILTVQLKNPEAVKREQVAKPMETGGDGTVAKQPVRNGKKVGRNDPCPCGSGKKYKKCCGANEQ